MKKLACLLVLLAGAASLRAQILNFNVNLNGAQEPTASTATGSGTATLDAGTDAFVLSGTFTGLAAAASAAHVHGPAAVGANAGILFGITVDAATSGNFSFNGTITSAQATDIENGLAYVNIHDSVFPGGEIRGQLTAVPEPRAYALAASLALVGFGGWRRVRALGR